MYNQLRWHDPSVRLSLARAAEPEARAEFVDATARCRLAGESASRIFARVAVAPRSDGTTAPCG
jgi:hypothetical protein